MRRAAAWCRTKGVASGERSEITPVEMKPLMPGYEGIERWGFYPHRYHYLGLRVVGENIAPWKKPERLWAAGLWNRWENNSSDDCAAADNFGPDRD